MPFGGISSRLRGLPRYTHVPSFGINIQPEFNPLLSAAKTKHFLASATWKPSILLFTLSLMIFLTPAEIQTIQVRGQCQRPNESCGVWSRDINACQNSCKVPVEFHFECCFTHWEGPEMTWLNMRDGVAQYFCPAAFLVHRIWYTMDRISPVWLSRLIIGCTWRLGPEWRSPRCAMIRQGWAIASITLQEAGSAPS